MYFDNSEGYARFHEEGRHTLTGRIELPQGTVDLLILRTLLTGPQHGWAISERVQQVSSEVLSIQQGSLYPALHRLEREGSIAASWEISENRQRVRVYRLTSAGRKRLAAERSKWDQLSEAIAGIFTPPVPEET